MVAKIDRTGEVNHNNFGSEMIIVGYKNKKDINIYFPKYDCIVKHKYYSAFKKGEIKCPYERRTYGIGYIGEGEYKIHDENGKLTKCYNTWHDMLRRCHSEELHKKEPTYIGCEVLDEFHNFQNFGEWDSENYYEIEGEKMHLDKDILIKGNKIYSPETCVYVPQTINNLFVKCDRSRGKYPIGVFYSNRDKKFYSKCRIYNFSKCISEKVYLGLYNTSEKAFEVYKEFKERNIKQVADYYKDKIPSKLYDALYNYEVEIDD